MSSAFVFDQEHDVYHAYAYVFPYSYTRLHNYLAAILKEIFIILREIFALGW